MPADDRRRGDLCSRSCGGHELVAFNLRGYAHATVGGGLYAHNLTEATDIDVIRLGYLLGQSNNEFNFAADRESGFRKEIEAAVTDVARLRSEFGSMRFVRKHAQRQRHVETPGFAAVGAVAHYSSHSSWNSKES